MLESADGDTWTSAAFVTEKDVDLRDPKFSITPRDRLMINSGGSARSCGKIFIGAAHRRTNFPFNDI